MQFRRVQSYVLVGAATLFLATGQRASADPTINLSFAGTTGSSTVSISLNGSSNSVEPGPYFFNVIPPPSGGGSPISTFCMELGQGVTTSSAPYNVVSLTDPSTTISKNNGSSAGAVANAIEALYGFYYNTAWGTQSGAKASNSTDFTAFQLAIWELVYDGASDISNPNATNFFSTGNLTSPPSSAEAEAQAMLNNVLNNVNQGITDFNENLPGLSLVALTNCSYQDQLWLDPTPKVTGVPAPPGIVLAGLGLFALIGRARLNRRVRAAA
jgi:hypothetical protein